MLLRAIAFLLFSMSALVANAQDLKWIPFKWVDGTFSGKHFDKTAIFVPLKINNIPANFSMQFDLGAVRTSIYGVSIKPYLEAYPDLKNKIDTSKTFLIQGETNPMFTNMTLKMGSATFKNIDVGYFKKFGSTIDKDSVFTATEKHIGTIGADLFQDKILIIDYPNNRIAVCEALPEQFKATTFQPFRSYKGRVIIPFSVNDEVQDVLFDTGSSLFALLTSKENAPRIADGALVDSLITSSWGKKVNSYGVKTKKVIKFGNKILDCPVVYYDDNKGNADFYRSVNILGLAGNIFFLQNTVIIDYKNKLFGVL